MDQADSTVIPSPEATATAALPPQTPGPATRSDRVPVLAWVIAAAFVAVLVATSGRYGFLQDELYFIVAGHHLAFGYVDQPPLAPLLDRSTGILGVNPTAVRIIPALAGGAIVIMTARIAALTSAVQAQEAALARAGQRPTSIFTGSYGEASALQVLGPADRLPPVLSGHNAYWTWGPGQAPDRTVLVVDALGALRPYFSGCRVLTTYHAPDQVQNDWTNLQIAVCTGPDAGWPALWPHLKHYG